MARPLRVEYAGAFYHVMNRGNAGGEIFVSRKDKEKFTEYLGKSVERFSIKPEPGHPVTQRQLCCLPQQKALQKRSFVPGAIQISTGRR